MGDYIGYGENPALRSLVGETCSQLGLLRSLVLTGTLWEITLVMTRIQRYGA